jgi:hypothetical protein
MKPFEYLPIERKVLVPDERVEDVYVRSDHTCFTPTAYKVLPRRKHLTDSECAAEYWHAAYYSVQPFFASMMGDLEVTDEVNDIVLRQASEAQIWRRFHDKPHALRGEL